MSEPPSISRRATAWWPAVIALEQVMDAITATALAVSGGAQVPRSGVRQLCDALRAVSEAAATGSALAAAPELPDDETLRPVSEAVRALLGVLGTGERLTDPLPNGRRYSHGTMGAYITAKCRCRFSRIRSGIHTLPGSLTRGWTWSACAIGSVTAISRLQHAT